MYYKSAVERAIEDAKRFIARAEVYIATKPFGRDDKADLWGSKESASVKRASMDVTRSMADLRQGRP